MPIVHLPPGNPGAKRLGLSAASLVLSRRCESRSAPAPWEVSTSAAANRPAGKRFGRVHISTRAQVYTIWTKYAFLNICQLHVLLDICKNVTCANTFWLKLKNPTLFPNYFPHYYWFLPPRCVRYLFATTPIPYWRILNPEKWKPMEDRRCYGEQPTYTEWHSP